MSARKMNTPLGKAFDVFNYTFLGFFALITFFPFLYIFISSFTSTAEILQKGFVFIPEHPTFDAYRYIFTTSVFIRSLLVSVFITVVGTAVNIILTSMMAYGLSHEHIIGRKTLMFMVVFTMLFSGGMIPNYLLVKNLGLINSFAALILPGAISAFNMIIMKNFFQQIPKELAESARIDGANDLIILWKVILPVSLPALATFSLFYAVGHWNTFMSAMLYLNDPKKWPIQVLLRSIVLLSETGVGEGEQQVYIPPVTIKMAVIVVATLPIMMVYPFLQKHFVKGMMVGSIKG
ncbi:MAG: carbohydrate ABC transporter permease [Bacteroidota bacterium]